MSLATRITDGLAALAAEVVAVRATAESKTTVELLPPGSPAPTTPLDGVLYLREVAT